MNKLHSDFLPRIAETLKTLGHPHRLRIFEALGTGEVSVGALSEELGIPQAIVSQQLKIMRGGQVVVSRREGPHVLYRLENPSLLNLLNCLYSCQKHCFPEAARAAATKSSPDARARGRSRI
jgi:DNA-binding transcriptional ArsR family regulator